LVQCHHPYYLVQCHHPYYLVQCHHPYVVWWHGLKNVPEECSGRI
jgi:hypothetical protein